MTEFMASHPANALTITLTHFLWQGLLVVVLYYGYHEVVKPASAQARYLTALAAMSVLTFCPIITLVFAWQVELTGHAKAVVTDSGSVAPPFEVGTMTESKPFESVAGHPSAESTNNGNPVTEDPQIGHFDDQRAFASSLIAFSPYVLLLWIAGVMLSGARLLAGVGTIVWLRGGRTMVSAELAGRTRRMTRRWKLRAHVFASDRIRGAAVVGFLKPAVMIPASWVTLFPADVLEAVIAHELAHIRRHDVWVNLLQRIVETTLFYHPAVWWLSNRIRLEREMCCDELAVEMTGEPIRYVTALEQVGRLSAHGNLKLATSFTGDEKMNLLRRVRNVLKINHPPSREHAWLVGMLAVAIPLLVVLGFTALPGNLANAVAQEREGDESPEAEAGPRESAEQEGRRSPEAEAGPRRSAEAEAGARRSPEAERGERRSAEGDRRNGDREDDTLGDFEPQTDREKELYQMIVQLRREMATLRRQVQAKRGDDRSNSRMRDRDVRRGSGLPITSREDFELSDRWKSTRDGRVFNAYDKNHDEVVELDEWLAMTNGNVSDARREIQTKRFHETDPNGDGKLTPKEFVYWYSIGRFGETEGRRGDRDREASERGPRDGERDKAGPRDGDAEKRGPRDGDNKEGGPRDGKRETAGPRDGDRE